MSEKINTIKNEFKPWLWSSLAILIYGLLLNLLSWQFKGISGGMPGYALLINYITTWPVGMTLFAINSMLILLAFLLVGRSIGIKSAYGYFLLSGSIDFFRSILPIQQLNVSLWWQLVSTALFGIIGGVTIGIVVFNKYGVGGYSIITPIVNKFKKVPAPELFLALDVILGILTLVVFGWHSTLVLMTNAVTFFYAMRWTMKKLV